MQTSANGLAFLKRNEGFAASIYNDNGKPAIGYGHDLQPGESFADGVSEDQATALLLKDLATRYEPAVNRLVPETCTQSQFDALVDFCYNLGPRDLAIMLAHGWLVVSQHIPQWCYEEVNGVEVKSDALLARRNAEVALFGAQ